jgi:small subunit ribosomal protein S6
LAYDINKRSSGIYYTIEFQSESGEIIAKMELALRRDERIMRFLTVRLDKFGVKYNEDKRAGKIAKVKEKLKRKHQRQSNQRRNLLIKRKKNQQSLLLL